ncbi:uncharacterized protein C3orf18 homolog [Cimex lectularius]|uniref:Small integral membrane protein 29 n=1 Tax=Cimex lectularius TaxID=79782 RepID=A0A8I6SDS6_CIMLE|nr:uncharacterized protein C3orf18 homolog [Cimex lectularius]
MSNNNRSTTEDPLFIHDDDEETSDGFNYLLVTFYSLFSIMILTVVVIVLMRRKKKIDRLRHNLMPFYNFAPGEEEDWETELLDADDKEGQSRRVGTNCQVDKGTRQEDDASSTADKVLIRRNS